MREHKLGSGVNWQGVLKQKNIKQVGVKKGLAYRHALLDFMEQSSLEGRRFSGNPQIFRILWNPKFYTVFTRTHDVPLSRVR
jgi:hypothetical protein